MSNILVKLIDFWGIAVSGKIIKGDIDILYHITEYKFLTVKQLVALSQRSTQVIRRRVRTLVDEGFIASYERGLGRGAGRRENIIVATEKCLKQLGDEGLISDHATYVTDNTRESIFLDHDLLVNWFLIHLVQINRKEPRLKIRHLTTSSHSLKGGSAEQPLLMERFAVDGSPDETITMIPDGVFVITDEEPEKSLLFFLEVDMGTETLQSTKQTAGDVRQKIINYQNLFRENHYKRYEKIFNAHFSGFRLLFLVNTLVRMKALSDLVQQMPPSDFIWVTDQEQMFSNGLSAEIWTRGGRTDRKTESILGTKLAFECKVPY